MFALTESKNSISSLRWLHLASEFFAFNSRHSHQGAHAVLAVWQCGMKDGAISNIDSGKYCLSFRHTLAVCGNGPTVAHAYVFNRCE